MTGPESMDDQVSSSQLEEGAGNSLSENPVKDTDNVFIGDVEEAKEAANDLELEKEEEEDKGHDPYNKAA